MSELIGADAERLKIVVERADSEGVSVRLPVLSPLVLLSTLLQHPTAAHHATAPPD